MKQPAIHSAHFAFFFLTLALLNANITAMKRSHADLGTTTWPEEVLWPILSLCPNATVMSLCKRWQGLLSPSNWKTILDKQPQMLARYSRHCQQSYYRLLKENDCKRLQTLLAADTHAAQHLQSLFEDENLRFTATRIPAKTRSLLEPYIMIDGLSYMKEQSQPSCETHVTEFTDIILCDDSERMKKYLQKYDRALQLEALDQHDDIIARYASIAMLTVLKSILQEDITMPNGNSAVAGDCIMAKAAMPKNGYRIDIVEYLLNNGATMDYDDSDESCIVGALSLAHKKNDYRLLELLVNHGLDVNPAPNQDRMICIKQPKGKSSPSLSTIFNKTEKHLPAITWAVVKQDARLVHILLILGADPAIKSRTVDVLTLAEELGNQDIIQALRFAKIKKTQETAFFREQANCSTGMTLTDSL